MPSGQIQYEFKHADPSRHCTLAWHCCPGATRPIQIPFIDTCPIGHFIGVILVERHLKMYFNSSVTDIKFFFLNLLRQKKVQIDFKRLKLSVYLRD